MNHSHRRRPLRRAVDHTAALVIAAAILPFVAWAYRDERTAQAGAGVA